MAQIDADQLSPAELEERLRSAEQVDCGADYDQKHALFFVREPAGWTRIYSARLFLKLRPDVLIGRVSFSRTVEGLAFATAERKQSRLLPVAGENAPYTDWTASNRALRLEYFLATQRRHKTFYDINNHSRSGHD